MNNLKLEIADFLGFVDLNGVDALDSDRVEQLENYIYQCNASAVSGAPAVVDAIYDRLCEILKQANPDSKVLKELWSDSDEFSPSEDEQKKDSYRLLKKYPMMSICTCKSYDCQELKDFVSRLPDNCEFDAHVSFKENGHGIRIVYGYGYIEDATSRMRASGGHNITKQVENILSKQGLENIEAIADYEMVEIRGEVVLPFKNFEAARQYNPSIVSPFSGVASMLRDSASVEENQLLEFVAYKIVSDEEYLQFDTKQEEYDFLRQLGFTTPVDWLIEGMTKETFMQELPGIVSDCEEAVEEYEYYTDGVVLEINDRALFNSLGSDGGKYNYGNIALKVDYWKQDLFYGYIQTILWTDGKVKYSPVAIVAEEPDMIEFEDGLTGNYIQNKNEISNWDELGVVTTSGNKVRRVPLYEPNNMVILNAYVGELLYFRYGGEAGVVPCFSDGALLSDARIKDMFDDTDFSADDYY